MPADGSDPLANYRAIRNELELHDARLGERPEIVVVSKAELPGAQEVRQQLSDCLGYDVLAMSAVTGLGLDKLLAAITRQLELERTPEATA